VRKGGGTGDVNSDGIPDLIVGARFDDNREANSGSARVFYSDTPFNWGSAPAPCPGDANGNRAVNFADITSVLANFNLMCP
jgi:hypothetical protein